MKLTKKTIDLICELEEIIGKECYNPNSFDGWTLEEGLSFRYPVTYVDKDCNERKTKFNVRNVNKASVDTIRYKFGSNNLYIGIGLVKTLEYLEKEFDLDFNQLVKKK